MSKDRVVLAEDIIWRRIDDEVVVIKDDGLSTHVLNETAALIWELCGSDYCPDDIATSLCERFKVDYDKARADVQGSITRLEEVGLLKRRGRM